VATAVLRCDGMLTYLSFYTHALGSRHSLLATRLEAHAMRTHSQYKTRIGSNICSGAHLVALQDWQKEAFSKDAATISIG